MSYGTPEEPTDSDWIETAEAWEKNLADFEAYIWPVFRAHGYTRDVAIQTYFGCVGDAE